MAIFPSRGAKPMASRCFTFSRDKEQGRGRPPSAVKAFHHYADLVIFGSAGITAAVVLATRFLWRRKKPLQEP